MKVRLRNAQRAVKFELACVRKAAVAAWKRCLQLGNGEATDVEVVIVDDAAIARVHGEFFHDPTPTDVITFPYGEILIGAETVAANARHYHETPSRELVRCTIHGMLHLRGFDDHTPAQRQKMERLQEAILEAVFPCGKEKQTC